GRLARGKCPHDRGKPKADDNQQRRKLAEQLTHVALRRDQFEIDDPQQKLAIEQAKVKCIHKRIKSAMRCAVPRVSCSTVSWEKMSSSEGSDIRLRRLAMESSATTRPR